MKIYFYGELTITQYLGYYIHVFRAKAKGLKKMDKTNKKPAESSVRVLRERYKVSIDKVGWNGGYTCSAGDWIADATETYPSEEAALEALDDSATLRWGDNREVIMDTWTIYSDDGEQIATATWPTPSQIRPFYRDAAQRLEDEYADQVEEIEDEMTEAWGARSTPEGYEEEEVEIYRSAVRAVEAVPSSTRTQADVRAAFHRAAAEIADWRG